MENNFNIFPWSDNWWIESNKAWFVIGTRNILCCYNMDGDICEFMIDIPDESWPKFRLTSRCMKYQNDIYCLPVDGGSIWVYSMEEDRFSEIAIANPHKEPLSIHDLWKYDDKIYAVSIGLKQIIEINTKEKKIENYYILCKEGGIARSTKAGTFIYCLAETSEKIYRFDLITRGVKEYKLPNIGRKYNTICFDGKDFWIGGYHKEIYVWNEVENKIEICSDFPEKFGIYSFEENTDDEVDYIADCYSIPAFMNSVAVGEYIWFIPFQTNKIVYADKGNHKLYAFEIAEESENRESLLGRAVFKAKYIFEYVRENRYLGLFSTKNNQIVEIDTEQLIYKWCDYRIDDSAIRKYVGLVNNVFYESDVWDKEIFGKMLYMKNPDACNAEDEQVGTDIYKKINA